MKQLMGEMLIGMKDMIVEKKGEDSLERILHKTGTNHTIFTSPEEVSAKKILELLENFCLSIHTTLDNAAEAYGEYCAQYYLPMMISHMGVDIKDSRTFLLKLNELHFAMAGPNATPPLFRYEWKNDDTLLLSYTDCEDWKKLPYYFFKGMVSGAAKYYNDGLQIFTGPSHTILVIFPEYAVKKRMMS